LSNRSISKQSREQLAYKKWIVKTLANYKANFALQGWDIRLEQVEDKKDSIGRDLIYSINVDPRYDQAYIKIYPTSFEIWKEDKESTAYYLLHEIAHIFTEPMAEFIDPYVAPAIKDIYLDIWENATQKISVALRSNLPRTLWDH